MWIFEVAQAVSMWCPLVNRNVLVRIAANSTVAVILASKSKYILVAYAFASNQHYKLNNFSSKCI